MTPPDSTPANSLRSGLEPRTGDTEHEQDVPPRGDLTTDVFLKAAESQLVGYKMIFEVSGQRETLDAPWPPSTLTDEELERLKERINQCLPVDGIFMDLWGWDVHFEDLLEDDWYFAAVFGDVSGIESCAEQLAEFFIAKCDEYDLDYGQWHRQEEFASEILELATTFLQDWRRNVVTQYGLGMPTT